MTPTDHAAGQLEFAHDDDASWSDFPPSRQTGQMDDDEALARALAGQFADDEALAQALAAQFEEELHLETDTMLHWHCSLPKSLRSTTSQMIADESEEDDDDVRDYFEAFEAPTEACDDENEVPPDEGANAPAARGRSRRVSWFHQSSKSTLRSGVRIDID
ncbi:hypothetical protein LEN26_008377 [Aphanomyces euteiches]|nr:hypothetical protein AeMF1_001531 [Aphanomyces euteiches]KAH9130587.1 hypothetical protein LEN26_008377 [Aphanomyces euteiches]